MGASNSTLGNKCWEGWNFNPDLSQNTPAWKPFKAVPNIYEEPSKTAFTVDGINYNLKSFKSHTVEVVPSASSYSGEVVIPATFEDEGITYKVTSVADSAFLGASITSVTIPQSVVKLGVRAFGNCASLASISGVTATTELGAYCFEGCSSLATPPMFDSMTYIPEGLYSGTPITELTFSDKTETVGARAFANCGKLTQLTLPKTLRTIRDEAFAGCNALSQIYVAATTPLSFNENVFSAETYANAVVTVPAHLESVYKASPVWSKFANLHEMEVDMAEGDRFVVDNIAYKVLSLEPGHAKAALTYHTVPGKAISDYYIKQAQAAYEGDIVVPSSVTYKGMDFAVTEMTDSAFYYATAATSVKLPDHFKKISSYAFYYTDKITSIDIPESCKSFADNAFASCRGLTHIEYPSEVEYFGKRVNSSCSKLETVVLPQNIDTLPDYSFFYCSAMKTIDLPASVKHIETNALSYTGLTEIELSESITTLPDFSSCKNLEKIIAKGQLTGITKFNNCENLKYIIWGDDAQGEIKYPEEVDGAYDFKLPEGITRIEPYAFNNCKHINVVFKFNNTLFFIGENAMKSSGQREAILPESVEMIKTYAFESSNVKTIVLGSNVNYTEDYMILKVPADTVYLLGTTPWTLYKSPGITKSQNSFNHGYGSDYAHIVVPTGYSDVFKAADRWPSRTKSINEPTIVGLSVEDALTVDGVTATLDVEPIMEFDIKGMPEAFVKGNKMHAFKKLHTAQLVVGKVGEDDYMVCHASYDNEGVYHCKFPTLEERTEYYYEFSVCAGEGIEATTGRKTFATGDRVSIDPAKVKMWVGEGSDSTAVTIRFADGHGMDNLVMGVRHNAGATDAEIVDMAVQGNSRLSRIEGGYAYDNTGRGADFAEGYDHKSVDDADNAWHIFRMGSFIALDYCPADASDFRSLDYAFYMPAADEVGAWLPSDYVVTLADGVLSVPVYVNAGEGGTVNSFSFNRHDADGMTSSAVVSNVTIPNAAAGNTMATLTVQGVGEVYLQVRPRLNNANGSYSEYCHLTVLKPEVAVASMAFAEPEVSLGFNKTYAPTINFNPEDATYTALAWQSSNTAVATVNATTGEVKTNATAGTAVITATYKYNPEVKAEFTINASLQVPVSDIILGDGSKFINLGYMDIYALTPTILPENADYQEVDVVLSNTDVATTYSVSAFNPSRRYFELVTHQVGTVDVTLKAKDGSGVAATYRFIVNEPDRTPAADSYQDGTIWLNEEWFGHCNGSLNYITSDGDVVYNAYETQNPWQAFGATSQYGTVYGGYLFVMSKQANDRGDTRNNGGGRLVVADAKTLQRVASFDELGGDGRAVVGVNPGKVYVGTNAGIRVLNFADGEFVLADEPVSGIAAGSAYAGQIGEMIAAGRYVFALKQSTGLLVIDAETDACVATIEDANAAGVAQTPDGSVWFAAGDKIYRIHPATAEVEETYTLPEGQSITCMWGSWKAANFFASSKENVLYWGAGSVYRWQVDEELPTEPFFTLDLDGAVANTKQAQYGTMRYDSRSNQVLMATTHGASSNYRYSWLHFINGANGELDRTIALKPYYWFPALPIFPDKYEPELTIDAIALHIEDGALEIGLDEFVNDPDNLNCNVKISLDNFESDLATVALDGRTLAITPLSTGEFDLAFTLESNGKVARCVVPVAIDTTDGAAGIKAADGRLWYAGGCLEITGYEGYVFTISDVNGRMLHRFDIERDVTSVPMPLPAGVYMAQGKSADGCVSLKFIVK
ncbi:MAG: leucine-rich repeat protein [Muribaculaceae bacterium]|nr:leucine-rich repeat protein [Muribaculaceae bacterium]